MILIYAAAGIVAFNVVFIGILLLMALEDDRRWRDAHGRRRRKADRAAKK